MVSRRWDGLVLTSPVTLIDNASVSTFEAVATSASLFGTQQRWGLVPSRRCRCKEGVALRGVKLLRVGVLAPVAGLPCRHAVSKCPVYNQFWSLTQFYSGLWCGGFLQTSRISRVKRCRFFLQTYNRVTGRKTLSSLMVYPPGKICDFIKKNVLVARPGSNSKTTLPLQMTWRSLRLTEIVVEILHLRTEVIGKKRLCRIRSLALMVKM